VREPKAKTYKNKKTVTGSNADWRKTSGHCFILFDANMPDDVQRFHTLGCSAGTRKNPQGQLDNIAKAAHQILAEQHIETHTPKVSWISFAFCY
jgi:hypothetical protein